MKKITALIITALLILLTCSIVWAANSRDIWLGDYLLLKIRCGAGGYSIDERADALQQRANNLLKESDKLPTFIVKKSGSDFVVYADDSVFITVTNADAKANSTTAEKLAGIWVERLRTYLPLATPVKPGVGSPERTE